jgi:hypothetical protein
VLRFIIYLFKNPPINLNWFVSICSVWPDLLSEENDEGLFIILFIFYLFYFILIDLALKYTIQTILLSPFSKWKAQPEEEVFGFSFRFLKQRKIVS